MASIARRPDGRWRPRYRDEAGRERAKHFARKADAQRWLDEVTASIVTGAYVDPKAGKVTFRAYAAEWLALQPLRPTTLLLYEQFLRLHINPGIGDRQLATIRPSHIQAMVAALGERLSPGVVRSNFVLTSSIFKAAILDRRLAVNPCVGVKLPEVRKRRIQVMTTEQVLALQECDTSGVAGNRRPRRRGRSASRRGAGRHPGPDRPAVPPAQGGPTALEPAPARLLTSSQ